MQNALLIFLGCGVGGLMRYWVSTFTYFLLGRNFPYGTLAVNFSGSFLMGFLFIVIMERFENSDHLRAFLLIGLLGGYTTFSSFSIETLNLIEAGNYLGAILNILLSLILCLVGVWIGVILGRQL